VTRAIRLWPAYWLSSLFLFLGACASEPAAPSGVTAFTFDSWDGPALKVYAVEPDGLAPDAPVVFVMHGVNRNADDYRDNWIDLANQYGFRIYAPEFSRAAFPGAELYNLGGVGTDAPSAYAAIEPLFADLVASRGVTAPGYAIFGHSAGAQFVHRFVCFAKPQHLDLAIAANAGWYTFPDDDAEWPYGLGGIDADACDPASWMQQTMLVMLGDQDKDPKDPNLRTTPEAMQQGATRFERGLRFYNAAETGATALGVDLRWRYRIVPGVAHDNRGMALAAAPVINDWAHWKDSAEEVTP